MLCNNATGYLKLQVSIVHNMRSANTEVLTYRSKCLVPESCSTAFMSWLQFKNDSTVVNISVCSSPGRSVAGVFGS